MISSCTSTLGSSGPKKDFVLAPRSFRRSGSEGCERIRGRGPFGPPLSTLSKKNRALPGRDQESYRSLGDGLVQVVMVKVRSFVSK